MPPHCDSMDGRVVVAAQQALNEGDVEMILSYIKRSAGRGAHGSESLHARRQGGCESGGAGKNAPVRFGEPDVICSF